MSKVSDFLSKFHLGRQLNELFQEAKPTLDAIARQKLTEVVTANFHYLTTAEGQVTIVTVSALAPFIDKVLAGLGPEAQIIGSEIGRAHV